MIRWIIDVVVAAVLIVAVLVACDRMPALGPIGGGTGGAQPTTASKQTVQVPAAVAPSYPSPAAAPAAPVKAPVAPAPGPTTYPPVYPVPNPTAYPPAYPAPVSTPHFVSPDIYPSPATK